MFNQCAHEIYKDHRRTRMPWKKTLVERGKTGAFAGGSLSLRTAITLAKRRPVATEENDPPFRHARPRGYILHISV